jgi:hypothetical protein
MYIYRYGSNLADSRLQKLDIKRLYAMDSTTITLIQVASYRFKILSMVYPKIKAMSLIKNPLCVMA